MDDELQALKEHFRARGLDDAECISLLSCWLGVAVARHSMGKAELDRKVDAIASWIRRNAEHVSAQLPTASRLQ